MVNAPEKVLSTIRSALIGTAFEGRVWLVGGAVRDKLRGESRATDLDFVTLDDALQVAQLLYRCGLSSHFPVEYPRFGTARITLEGIGVEFATARNESYSKDSRKPTVRPATIEEDARRRDFTVNALYWNIFEDSVLDPLGVGLADLNAGVLRTPLDPSRTFSDDPLRMLRAVRFKWKLGLSPDQEMWGAIRTSAERLAIISAERIQEELMKMLGGPMASGCLRDLMDLALLGQFAPEFLPMVGCDQPPFHHLDVWDHTLLAIENCSSCSANIKLALLFHDIGKPSTKTVEPSGRARFFGHEAVGAEMAESILRRLKFPLDTIQFTVLMIRNHMRLGSASVFSKPAARRLLRDLGPHTEDFLTLVDADSRARKAEMGKLDLQPIRDRLEEVRAELGQDQIESPLSGSEIMHLLRIGEGSEVGRAKEWLAEQVILGGLAVGDKKEAKLRLKSAWPNLELATLEEPEV